MPYLPAPSIFRRLSLAALFFLLTMASCLAQSTRGTEFWVAFMAHPGTAGQTPNLSLYITSREGASGTVFSSRFAPIPFTVAPNSVIVVNPPANLFLSPESEGVANRGLHIVTDDTVDVWAVSYAQQTMDATLVLEKGALGTEYRVMSYTGIMGDNNVPIPSQFLIVGTREGTVIEITPTTETMGGRPPGVPFTITLNTGETYQVQARGDLTGTRVVATNHRPFALFSGVARGRVPVSAAFQNHLFEQMFPITRWGTAFVGVPYRTRSGDTYRILASQNNTTVRIDGGGAIVLNDGEFIDTILTQPTPITSDKPVSIAQFSHGSTFDNVFNADPFMAMLSPLDFTRHEAVLPMFEAQSITRHYVNIVAYTADTASIRFDGAPIGHLFSRVPNDGFYSYATVETGQGVHTVSSELGAVITMYGYGPLEGYGNAGGAERLVGCPFPTIAVLGDTMFCDGGSVTLDAGAGYARYKWSNGETTRQITVRQSGEFSVITTDSNGCQKPARPVRVQVFPLPAPQITVVGPTLLCPCDSVLLIAPPSASILWSNGATTDTIVVREPGTFSITTTNEFGCQATSESITIGKTDVTSTVALGNESAAPGGRVSIPLLLTSSGGLTECGAQTFIATLRFNASLLQIERFTGGNVLDDTIIGSERFVIVEGSMEGDTLITLDGFAALGNAESTGLRFIWFRWDRCALIPVDAIDGEFTLLDLCREGDTRLLDGSGDMALKQNMPNPVKDRTIIEYEITEDGHTRLYVTDVLGRTVLAPLDEYQKNGRYTLTLDASALPVGNYYYVLETATQRLGRIMKVVR